MAENKEGKKERLSPEEWEKRQQRNLERKLKLAQRDDMGIVSRRTLDSADFIHLFVLTEAERIKEELNLLNAEMCKELGREYKPPYGFGNPLKVEIREQESGLMTETS